MNEKITIEDLFLCYVKEVAQILGLVRLNYRRWNDGPETLQKYLYLFGVSGI